MRRLKLPEPISGGLFLTYQCNAECRHCMYACSPKWEGWISGKDLKTVLGFLIKQDFKGLLLFARDFGFQESEEGYISKCDLCLEIRKHLLTKKEFDELKPTEFYSHLK